MTSTHDFGSAAPRPAAGVAWDGLGSWTRRPPVTSEVAGLFTAGPFSPAGPGGSAEVLSGALAAYAVQGVPGSLARSQCRPCSVYSEVHVPRLRNLIS